jgi:S1-C subfamily serine protease
MTSPRALVRLLRAPGIYLLILLAAVSCDSDDPSPAPAAPPPVVASPLSEDTVRRITREEIERALAARDREAANTCDIADAATRVMPSIVKVEVRRKGSVVLHGSGTGFVALAGGIVVTAAHVISTPLLLIPGAVPDITLVTVEGQRISAEVLRADSMLDLAVLRATDRRLPPVRWADSSALTLGEPMRIVGFPVGRDGVTVTGGVIANHEPAPPHHREEIISDADADPGNSGGPLLTSCGEALGVVVERRLIATTTSTVAVGAGTALPFVVEVAKAAATAVPATGTPALPAAPSTATAMPMPTSAGGTPPATP